MKEMILECRGFASRSDLHETFAEALSFPEWYGNNLDALHDQLTSLGEETVVQLLHWEEAESALGRYAAGARRAMEDAAQENPFLRIVFL